MTCALGPYNFEFMTEVTKEIVAAYKVDGVFANRWQGHGICYCDSCRTQFKAFCGMDLPRDQRPEGPGLRATGSSGATGGSSSCGGCGTARSARSTPPPATSPTAAAGR